MSFESLPRALVWVLAAYGCFYLPGLGLVASRSSAAPPLFARTLASAIVTTIAAAALTAAERFSLPSLLALDLVAAVFGLLARRLWRDPVLRPGRDALGPVVFALALAAYWPGYPAFLGASDSTAYVATGISLAHHGTLARDDELGQSVPRPLREALFDTMSQVFGSTGPPFRRMPGAMMLASLDAPRAWPCFFPVPSIWSAIFVAADVPGAATAEQGAPDYAPVFGALALWAFWLLARAWLRPGFALVATVLLGASAPFYTAARMPLSEGIASFFLLGGLAVLALADSAGPRRQDAILAGAALGAAVFTRMETALLLAMAFAMMPAFRAASSAAAAGSANAAAWPRPAFFVTLAAVASLAIAQVLLLPGSYLDPLLDHLSNVWLRYHFALGAAETTALFAIVAASALLLAVAIRIFGASATLRWGFLLAVLGGHAAAATFLWSRTPLWLSFYIGWSGLALAAAGLVLARRDCASLPGASLILALATAAILVLFYNPHVYPSLPWGARRYAPLLLPMLLLAACYASSLAASRSRLLGFALLAVLCFEIAEGGRPVWGKDFLAGAWEQLEEIAGSIPPDGTLLIDRDVSPMMLGPALWLIHDRNGITIPPTGSAAGRVYIPPMVWEFARRGPVYFLTRGAGDQIRTPRISMNMIARSAAGLPLLEQTHDRLPEKVQRYIMPLAVYQLRRDRDPKGARVD